MSDQGVPLFCECGAFIDASFLCAAAIPKAKEDKRPEVFECRRCTRDIPTNMIMKTVHSRERDYEATKKAAYVNAMKKTRAVVDVDCIGIDCTSEQAFFTSQQIRSVDEGATIFYECTKCGEKWSVNN